MKWRLPAKTFLLGEYAALAERGAIVLTTMPCFELRLIDIPGLHGIHPESPAGRWWIEAGDKRYGLAWVDPTNHCGGLGASSAQFVGAYLATSFLQGASINQQEMLDAYWQCAWSGEGVRPSGYDVLAQYLGSLACSDERYVPESIYIHHHRPERLAWPFNDLSFIIAHTGYKLATHHHLADIVLSDDVSRLDALVRKAYEAFSISDSNPLIEAVNGYHDALSQMHRVCENTQRLVSSLQRLPDILAVKGCGAMGADVLICLTRPDKASFMASQLSDLGLSVVYASHNVNQHD